MTSAVRLWREARYRVKHAIRVLVGKEPWL